MLKCSACGHENESLECESCQGQNPADAVFCCYCGKSLAAGDDLADDLKHPSGGDPYDLKNRVLCSDESCIGIINEKGVCTDCGKPLQGKA
jgi:hypothetical protein